MKNKLTLIALGAAAFIITAILISSIPFFVDYVKITKNNECKDKFGSRYAVMFLDGFAYCYDAEGESFHGTGYIPLNK